MKSPGTAALRLHLLIAIMGLVLGGCAEQRPRSLDQPLVVIGIDAADWTWIAPLMDEGRMPRLSNLVERGVRAPLQSLVPLQKSPTIWTTIATGKRPAKHGIADFITHDQKVQNSALRTAAAYWEILGQLGRTQAVIGWWVTHPATPVRGILVSDFLPYFGRGAQPSDAAIYPAEETHRIDALRVRPEDIDDAWLGRFVDLQIVAEYGEQADALLEDLRAILAADESYRRIAAELLAKGGFDVFTVYFRGLDMVCHEYWRYFEPEHSSLGPDDWRVRMLGGVVPEYHAYVDELIGTVLDLADPAARVVVVSDHGFVGHRRSRSGLSVGVDMHREDGILVLSGDGIRQRARLDGATVKDVMPTVLGLCGVPLARDLDGHFLVEALEPAAQRWSARLLAEAIDSYEDIVPRDPRGAIVSEEVNEEILEQLRSLGYID
jgi:predicted AlkP superfamily phosphohydrolase/phosphomutase